MASVEERPRIVLVNRCIVLNKQNEGLVVRRAGNDHTSPGLWEFPGGKLDEGQDVYSALEREVFEETGLIIPPPNALAVVTSRVLATGKYRGLPYIVLCGTARYIGGELQLSKEHDDARWGTYEELRELGDDMTYESQKALVMLGASTLKRQTAR